MSDPHSTESRRLGRNPAIVVELSLPLYQRTKRPFGLGNPSEDKSILVMETNAPLYPQSLMTAADIIKQLRNAPEGCHIAALDTRR